MEYAPVSYTHLDVYKRQKLDKSKFIAKEVKFLGFNLTEEGISPSQEKVDAIQNFPSPRNKKQLQSFLGEMCIRDRR